MEGVLPGFKFRQRPVAINQDVMHLLFRCVPIVFNARHNQSRRYSTITTTTGSPPLPESCSGLPPASQTASRPRKASARPAADQPQPITRRGLTFPLRSSALPQLELSGDAPTLF